jgi:LacI family transcriptional regulator
VISSLELARRCGVSQGTVDRALKGRGGINAGTRERILAAAAEHGYCPNPAARELMTGESRMAGAIVPSTAGVFFLDLMRELKQALDPIGLRLLLTTAESPEEFQDAIAEFAARRLRAAIVVPPAEGIALPAAVTRTLKVVSYLSPCLAEANHLFLAPDEARTGHAAVNFLASRGHRRILHLTYRREATAIRDRARGYQEAMTQRGWESAVVAGADDDTLDAALERYRPTALFCHNDWLAAGTLRFLKARGRRVPAEISVLGVDHTPTFRTLQPGVASLEYPLTALAARTAAWIVTGARPAAFPPFRPVPGASLARRSRPAHAGRRSSDDAQAGAF